MKIEGNPILNSEFINELQSYLSGNVGSDGKNVTVRKMVKIVKKTDFQNLPLETQRALHSMVDPSCDISEEVFKRQLDLYFSLMEDNDGPQRIPVFSEYVEWLYRQESRNIPDKMFDLMTSRLLKTKAKTLPESVSGFFDGLTEEYKRDIDKISNERLKSLIGILNGINLEFEQMPDELKNFVRQMFIRCAVKTEIADRNKTEIRNLFKDDPSTYYNWFNKAFAGYGNYQTWIDEPAKKLSLRNMINYANMQDIVVKNGRRGLSFQIFQAGARSLGLRRLPEYKVGGLQFGIHYLPEPREYKDYAKKMTKLFTQMIKAEIEESISLKNQGVLLDGRAHRFGQTSRMWEGCEYVLRATTPAKTAERYADFLVSLVHLDSLTGLTKNQLFEEIDLKTICETANRQNSTKKLEPQESKSYMKTATAQDDELYLKRVRQRYQNLIEDYNEIITNGGKAPDSMVDELMRLEEVLVDERRGAQPGDEE